METVCAVVLVTSFSVLTSCCIKSVMTKLKLDVCSVTLPKL